MKRTFRRITSVALSLCLMFSMTAAAADSSSDPPESAEQSTLTQVQDQSKILLLKVNETQAYLNGSMVSTPVSPGGYVSKLIFVNGAALLPLRFVCESLNLEVGYNAATNHTTVTDAESGFTFELEIGTTQIYKYDSNGALSETVTATAPTILIEGVTHIAVRSLLEAMGFYVHWDDKGYVLITDLIMTGDDFQELINVYDESIDRDGDGLPDVYENDTFGTDPANPDTDGDGLPDGYEFYTLATDPLKTDTDGNGLTDANEDFDEDGLTNLKEFECETDPMYEDTDDDGLSDYAEIHTYNTDPLCDDTDSDGLLDGEEGYDGTIWAEYGIYFDPLKPDTDGNGTPDGEETFNQTIEKDFTSHDGAVTNISVEMTTDGSLSRNLGTDSLYNVDMMSTGLVGLVGDPIDFTTTSDFEEATLTFTVDRTKLEEGVEFENLAVLWYDEENQTYELVDSTVDPETSTVTATVNHFSEYTIVDGSWWEQTWTAAPRYIFGTHMYAVFNKDPNSAYDADENCRKLGGHSVTITSAEEQANVVALLLASNEHALTVSNINVAPLISKAITTHNKYFLGLTRENADYPFSWLTGEPVTYTNWMPDQPSGASNFNIAKIYKSSGQWSNKVTLGEGLSYWDTGFICEWEDFTDVIYPDSPLDRDNDGLPDFMEIGGIALPNGEIVYTDPNKPDTDGDGILDGDEISLRITIVDFDPITHEPIYGVTGFSFTSNPTSTDTDGDGISDHFDQHCFRPDTIESLFTLSKKNKPSNPIYIEVNGNDVTITAHVKFIGDAQEIFPGTDKTCAQIAKEGIERKWSTVIQGGKLDGITYDFVAGLVGKVTTRVITDDPLITTQKKLVINVDLRDDIPRNSNTSYSAFNPNWSVTNCGLIILYKKDMSNYIYKETDFEAAAAHEFGHTLGLKDAYPNANNGIRIVDNPEINDGLINRDDPTSRDGNSNIMFQNDKVFSNDMEMVLEAFSKNQKQYYLDIPAFSIKKSRVVRLPQIQI